jgi:hypothetical protein
MADPGKETIGEIIFRTTKVRNRLMLEFMARGGMRVGEVLSLTAMNVKDQKLTIKNPKSGKPAEVDREFIQLKVDILGEVDQGLALTPEYGYVLNMESFWLFDKFLMRAVVCIWV